MMNTMDSSPFIEPGFEYLGLRNIKKVHWHHVTPVLYEHAIRSHEGIISSSGPLVVSTGKFTGRSPNDKYIVKDEGSADKVNWGKSNFPYSPEKFEMLYERALAYLQNREIYVQDAWAGADDEYKLPIRIITLYAWQALFARNMFIRINDDEVLKNFVPGFTLLALPKFIANPVLDEINSETFIMINFTKKIVLIGGTHYAGEIKKAIFTVLNYLLPQKNVLGMHCSANVGKSGDTALLFGLSGTGKTTLSADPNRRLIGDDEHGWSEHGIFNFEGGCYAKVIRLSPEAEPEIWETTRKFGTILENVVIDQNIRVPDLDDATMTENTRAAYPLTHLENIEPSGKGDHPKNIIFLTADAFGVLPPISKLTTEQAMYQFLLGYTAKVAGTERGVTEPQATFSTCFGAPFMPLHPSIYANQLGSKIKKHNVKCWLVNTGWIGGSYGVGNRISIKYTRALLNAALEGKLDNVEFVTDEYFNLSIPTSCEGVPSDILNPKNTWENQADYDTKAKDLAKQFVLQFKGYEPYVSEEVIASGPKVK